MGPAERESALLKREDGDDTESAPAEWLNIQCGEIREEEEDCIQPGTEHSRDARRCETYLLRNLLPDEPAWVRRHGLMHHVKFLKLVVISILVTIATRELSCALPEWSCVRSYGPAEYFLYYWNEQCCDLLILFLLGRMFQRRGADTPLFLLMCLLGSLFPSAQDTVPFMRVSLSLYAINCQWQVGTWIWVVAEVLIVLVVVAKHVQYAFSNRLALVWALEACALVLVVIVPQASDPAFHFHHWVAAWIMAIVARFEPAWSVATQAFFVGYYLNGIAIYGRHPILACKQVYFESDQQHCTLGKNTTNGTQPIYVPPNPWNCSGDYARRDWMPQGQGWEP
jgi:hypothetical protein